MPRFFFHVVHDTSSLTDEHGTILPNLEAAHKEARKILGEILADELRSAVDLIRLTITIDDAGGHRVGETKTVTTVTTTTGPLAG
ncbi:DUF6894 family protein [Sphingomonas sp. RT2P30]|uniref:DUF6894 family protein n=1 Tax=Parasphingomonas halimpatiens TaxID=3096162 RepID=UPI003FA76269